MNGQSISNLLSNWLFILFVLGIPLYAWLRKVNIFESFTCGAKDGFQLAIKIIPPLVAILVAIGMFRAAGGFALLSHILKPMLTYFGFPVEVLPLALIRPFSGGASNAMLAELAHQHGGDSYISYLAATIMGSTETTFYVVAVYFGAVMIRRTRYAIGVGLFADLVGVISAFLITRLMY